MKPIQNHSFGKEESQRKAEYFGCSSPSLHRCVDDVAETEKTAHSEYHTPDNDQRCSPREKEKAKRHQK